MSHPDNGSTTALDMFISLPGKGNPPETMRSGHHRGDRCGTSVSSTGSLVTKDAARGPAHGHEHEQGHGRSAPVGVATNARPRRSGQEQAPSNDTR